MKLLILLYVLICFSNYSFSQEVNFLRYKNFDKIPFFDKNILINEHISFQFVGNSVNESYLSSENEVTSILGGYFLKNDIISSDKYRIFYNGNLTMNSSYESYFFTIEYNSIGKFHKRGLLRLNVKNDFLCSTVYLFYESSDSDLNYKEYTLFDSHSRYRYFSKTFEKDEIELENRYSLNDYGFIEIIKFN